MKFHLGSIPESVDFNIDETWNPIGDNQKSIWFWQLKALPIAIINLTVIISIWILLTPAKEILLNLTFPLSVIGCLISLIGVLIVHEIIHAVIHPSMGFSSRTTIGFWPSRMLLYAVYDGELTRSRYLIILIMPFIIISLLPIIFSVISGIINLWIIYISAINAFLASGDITAIGVIRKLPPGSIIRNDGSNSYWKQQIK